MTTRLRTSPIFQGEVKQGTLNTRPKAPKHGDESVPTSRRTRFKSSHHPRFPAPRLFRQKRLLIVGCGACGLQIAQQKARHWRIIATTTQVSKLAGLRAAGTIPLLLNLDLAPNRSRRWTALATAFIVLVPPQKTGQKDTRARQLARLLQHQSRSIVALHVTPTHPHLVYISTSGVYGDTQGRWIDETQAVHPQSDRAKRRVDAENVFKRLGKGPLWSVNILRAPGIYSQDRLPLKRLAAGTPNIFDAEDSYSNHISEIDLGRSALMALQRGKNQRVFNANDNHPMKIGAYFDSVADAYGFPRPPRASRSSVQQQLTPLQWSFLQESRRLCNRRLRKELRLRLRYPSVLDALAAWPPPVGAGLPTNQRKP